MEACADLASATEREGVQIAERIFMTLKSDGRKCVILPL